MATTTKSKGTAKKATATKPAAKAPAKKAAAKPASKSSAAKAPAKPAGASKVKGDGTKAKPWQLTTPSGSSEYVMYKDESADPPTLYCIVGKTELKYQWRALDDLYAMLKKNGDWVLLGSADEQKPAAEGTVEAWGRSADNPVGGWYGMKKGLRGRFGMYIPPLMEVLGMAEVEHNPKGNRMRAI